MGVVFGVVIMCAFASIYCFLRACTRTERTTDASYHTHTKKQVGGVLLTPDAFGKGFRRRRIKKRKKGTGNEEMKKCEHVFAHAY